MTLNLIFIWMAFVSTGHGQILCRNGKPAVHDFSESPTVTWQSPSLPNSDLKLNCNLTLTRGKDEAKFCQVRIDFKRLNLAQPTAGVCGQDRLEIHGRKWNPYGDKAICGREIRDQVSVGEGLPKEYLTNHREFKMFNYFNLSNCVISLY